MNRLCIFAHWDRDSIIDDYVIYYLKSLKEVCSQIIFVSDCDLSKNEIAKLEGIADYVIAQKHGEYDFGSYKRGFLYARENNLKFDELLFANDSCYGPFYSLKPVFEKMDKKKCDFWGLTQNGYGIKKVDDEYKIEYYTHIQSYFMLLKKKVFESGAFLDFIKSVKQEKYKEDIIINYEIGLNRLIDSNHFKKAVFINKYPFMENSTLFKWDVLIKKHNFPFIKTSVPRRGLLHIGPINSYPQIIHEKYDYPTDMIESNAARYLNLYEDKYSEECLYRRIRFHVLQGAPIFIRTVVIFIEKYSFKILNTICFHKLKKF